MTFIIKDTSMESEDEINTSNEKFSWPLHKAGSLRMVWEDTTQKTDSDKLHPAVETTRVSFGNEQVNTQLKGWDLIHSKNKEDAVRKLDQMIENEECEPFMVGKFGETILHYALLFRNEEIAEYLIKHKKYGRTLRKAVYGKKQNVPDCDDLYQGEGCLHLAIANRSKKMVMMLLEYGTSSDEKVDYHEMSFFDSETPLDLGYPLNTQRATGVFFQGEVSNSVFFGETALDFAVSTNQLDMVDILMGFNWTPKDTDWIDFSNEHSKEKRKFNGKWRASLKLKDTKYRNTVFHFCALKGHANMWHCLTEHLETTVGAESNSDDDSAIELEADMWVRSQVNKYGFTPLQLAAYNNHTKIVKTILNRSRIRSWKWGNLAYHAYTLNEIDDFFDDVITTPGIPVTNIILSEGCFELLSLQVLSKLMEDKWASFGKKWTWIFGIIQLLFIFSLTVLFLCTHPNLSNLETPWGREAMTSNWLWACYIFVLVKAVWEILTMWTEMVIIFLNNLKLQKYILQQKLESQKQTRETERRNGIKVQLMSYRETCLTNYSGMSTDETIVEMFASESWCETVTRYWLSVKCMKALYFEHVLPDVPLVFQNPSRQQRDYNSSVAGFFLTTSWLSNVGFLAGQVMVMYSTRDIARALIYLMIFILVLEYLQLFLWLQTSHQVGRFISAMVTIIYKDVRGFLVVLVVILVGFTACFIILMKKSESIEDWVSVIWLIYELSVGTGEFLKDEMDFIDNESFVDPYRRALILVTYVVYITLMLLVLMNLLIAVMSQTADALSSEMQFREKRLKLSSISLITRRLYSTWRMLSFGCCKRIPTEGGESGNCIKLSALDDMTESEESLKLKDYYTKIHYLCSLEEEIIEIDKDRRIQKKPRMEKSPEEKMLDITRMIKMWLFKGPMSELRIKQITM